jgi:hypothetical protein
MQITINIARCKLYLNSTNFQVFFCVKLIEVDNIELDVIGDVNTYTSFPMSLCAKMHWDGGVCLFMLSDVVVGPCQSIYLSCRYGAWRDKSLGCVSYDIEGLCVT